MIDHNLFHLNMLIFLHTSVFASDSVETASTQTESPTTEFDVYLRADAESSPQQVIHERAGLFLNGLFLFAHNLNI